MIDFVLVILVHCDLLNDINVDYLTMRSWLSNDVKIGLSNYVNKLYEYMINDAYVYYALFLFIMIMWFLLWIFLTLLIVVATYDC